MIYLYVKTHNKTGLKYLGKTINEDPYKYTGSGKYWLRHLKKYGTDYTTQILLVTEDKDELKQTGLFFSKIWNIVKSKEWANLMPESGNGGKQEKLLNEGKHNFQNSEVQRKIQLNRVKKGTHNLQSKNRNSTRISRKGIPHPVTLQRNLTDDNPFRGNIPCIDKNGNSIMIEKSFYYAQNGNKEDWNYVHTKSKEAKKRKLLTATTNLFSL
jgi:hypothetical protein